MVEERWGPSLTVCGRFISPGTGEVGEAEVRRLPDQYVWDDGVKGGAIINKEHSHIAPTVF